MSIVLAVVISIHLFNVSSAPPALLVDAQRDVVRIYAKIGVDVEWSDSPSALPLIVRDEEPGQFRRSANTVMGAAVRTANGNPVAYVFYRRARDAADRYATPASAVVAGAMAHEIGHLLLPSREHARDGLMRACWAEQEFLEAAAGHLRFSPTEASQIRDRASITRRTRPSLEPR